MHFVKMRSRIYRPLWGGGAKNSVDFQTLRLYITLKCVELRHTLNRGFLLPVYIFIILQRYEIVNLYILCLVEPLWSQ
jgi:hypothetical protein